MNPTDSHEGGLGVRDQIERYRSAFIAVVTMIVIAAVVGGYILAHENIILPGWFPVLGKNYYTLKADLQTAQALTPEEAEQRRDRWRQDDEALRQEFLEFAKLHGDYAWPDSADGEEPRS